METDNYYLRKVDTELLEWAKSEKHKPLLLRGARQVGKSSAVRHLAQQFEYFVEINFERQPSFKDLFTTDLNITRICSQLSSATKTPIIAGKTLLFLDEIQESKEAINALRYFYEDMPELHVVAAGSLLEFTLQELPTFGVGRIRSMFIYPFSFYEFLGAVGNPYLQKEISDKHDFEPLPQIFHEQLLGHLKDFLLLGGMPEVVSTWANTADYTAAERVLDDIIVSYQLDFAKYKTRISPLLLQNTLVNVARQAGQKFVYSEVSVEIAKVKEALSLLTKAGLIAPVTHTAANAVPLGAETNEKFRKFILLDTGLMLNLLSLDISDLILQSNTELAGKGGLAEVYVGTELMKATSPYKPAELFYWQNLKAGGQAEIDYVVAHHGEVLPIEVKSGQRGSMKSLYYFLEIKNLQYGIRTSMENYGLLEHVKIQPLYAIGHLD